MRMNLSVHLHWVSRLILCKRGAVCRLDALIP